MFRFRPLILLAAFVVTAGCVTTTAPPPTEKPRPTQQPPTEVAARNFTTVVRAMEPVAEQVCRERAPRANCDFKIVIDDRANQPPNAFQTLDRSGRPIIAFTLALIAESRNRDELAFILGHEAAHHIAGHLPRQRESALEGAVLGGLAAAILGADVGAAQELGAQVGARRYSKGFELEADRLGTVITMRGGFDPLRGSLYFNRIPDPGNKFLGTHPPNNERLRVVRETVAQMRS